MARSRIVRTLIAAVAVVAGSLTAVEVAAPAARAAAPIVAFGGADQIWSDRLPANTSVTLVNSAGAVVKTQKTSYLGALLFRNVPAGPGYRLKVNGALSGPITVHTDADTPWNLSAIRSQNIPDTGYGYLTTRDGTKLAYMVSLPTRPATLGVGLPADVASALQGPLYAAPYPTLIEYSGYGTADPKGPQNGISALANLMGFAVVDVQIRGSGCSGGAYDFFERMQELDAYDAIEAVAAQPWVKGHKVGMLGISYGGISQLFAAMTRPPSLAAIAPLSTIDSVATTLLPGGIVNDGFALDWAKERVHDALPSGPNAGQAYAATQIAAGDTVCKQNQAMHSQALDLMAKVRANEHYIPSSADPLDPITFVNKINVPTFLACQFEDEQTGGHCPDLYRHMTGTTKKWAYFTNGSHGDSLDPATLSRLFDFYEIYVAQESPLPKSVVLKLVAPLLVNQVFGTPLTDPIPLPNDPIQLQLTLAGAQQMFEAQPPITVMYDNGAGKNLPTNAAGDPIAAFERGYTSLPAVGTTAARWYLSTGGHLAGAAPGISVTDTFVANPKATPLNSYSTALGTGVGTGALWGNASQWTYAWKQPPAANQLSYVTPPLTKDTTVLGAGAVYVWVKSSTPDVDLQATVTEIRPDGQETFVQNGWQRLSERKLAGATGSLLKQPSTEMEPYPTMLASDARPMPAGAYTKVAIPLYYEGHVYRAGSHIRVTISGLNGDQPIWNFVETEPATGTSTVTVGLGAGFGSYLVLPVTPDGPAPTPLPACPALRNEPCRPYVATANHDIHIFGTVPRGL